jgi:hypothetical protein
MAGFLVGTDPGLRQTRTPTVDVLTDGVGYTSGSSTTITLSDDPGSENHVVITFDGVVQHHDTYSQSGAVITFDAAIPSGVAKIEAIFTVTVASSTVPDASVTVGKLATTGTPNGTLFLRDDMAWTAAGGGLTSVQTFTSSGTWTKPAGISYVKVTVVGGGGGGGAATKSSQKAVSAGGGGGGTAIEYIDVSAISSETITIGAGGSGGASSNDTGSTGGTSSFGSHCSATGGVGGAGGQGTVVSIFTFGGVGGSGANGDLNFDGDAGGSGYLSNTTQLLSGSGGSTPFSGTLQGVNGQLAGYDGVDYGSGGTGACSNGSTYAGGDGFAGLIIVEEYA